jgi:polyphosphate kinase 2 (PPK2 family)
LSGFSFKTPSTKELDHDFMWRTTKCAPERGRIGIFNRSYYEELLIVRVHPEILAKQRIPSELVTKKHLARALRGYFRIREVSGAQWHADPEILSQRLEGRAAQALS